LFRHGSRSQLEADPDGSFTTRANEFVRHELTTNLPAPIFSRIGEISNSYTLLWGDSRARPSCLISIETTLGKSVIYFDEINGSKKFQVFDSGQSAMVVSQENSTISSNPLISEAAFWDDVAKLCDQGFVSKLNREDGMGCLIFDAQLRYATELLKASPRDYSFRIVEVLPGKHFVSEIESRRGTCTLSVSFDLEMGLPSISLRDNR